MSIFADWPVANWQLLAHLIGIECTLAPSQVQGLMRVCWII